MKKGILRPDKQTYALYDQENNLMKKNILRRLLGFIRPHLYLMVVSLICAIINIMLTLYAPILVGKAVDMVVARGQVNFAGLRVILGHLGIVIACTALLRWMMFVSMNRVSYLTIRDIRIRAFERLSVVPLKFIDSQPHGDVLSRIITDTENISDGLLMGITQLFSGVVAIFGAIGFMWVINVKITLLVVLVTPLSLFVTNFIAKRSFHMFRLQSEARGDMTALVTESIGNQKLVKAFGYEPESERRFAEINERLKEYGTKALFFSSISNPSTRFVNGIVYAGVGVIGALFVISGILTVGQLSCFLSYANQYTRPFNEISGVVAELQSALASAKRVFEIIDAEPQTPDAKKAEELTQADGSVELQDISFSYSVETKLIEGLNLSVQSGQKIAIVGRTGCGKTTLINLLMRFYDVNSGQIVVSGRDIQDVTRNSLRSMYGMVLQDTWLKSGTIRENIAYGKPNASEYEIVSAAVAARADCFIKRMPNGYDTVINEEGDNISEGQKQLLCIARVMLALPPMLILDEATSSIDTRTEFQIQEAFADMMKGRTSFIVAHRLSTIKEADTILVMDSGRIIEQGSHNELIEREGFYSNLYQCQFSV